MPDTDVVPPVRPAGVRVAPTVSIAATLGVVLALALGACASSPEPPPGPTPEELARITPPAGPVTLAALVAGTPELSILAAALERSGLAAAYDRPDETLTLFAPTDAAFSRVPGGTMAILTGTADRDRLEYLVTSSTLDATVTAADLAADLERGRGRWDLANARGATLTVRLDVAPDDSVEEEAGDAAGARSADIVVELVGSDPARIVRADVPATNGVLHVIDAVLVPLESVRP